MTGPVSFDALAQRFNADRRASHGDGASGPEARLTRALDAIGWRSAGGESLDDVAAFAVQILAACVTGHRNTATAVRDIADLMRQSMADLDGSMPPASAFVPAAEDVLRRYVAD
ncbi:MAG: hypothetical protein JWM41_4360 [Gemmatimonadetes bacterium]|nr:hypothetical protein [Gemmatimonadota bacterium]